MPIAIKNDITVLDVKCEIEKKIGKTAHSNITSTCTLRDFIFSLIGQEYPFLQVSEIFLSWPAVSA